MDRSKLLRHLDGAIIDEDTLQQIENMANETILMHRHPYKLTLLPNGRWQSYFKEKDGSKRICVRAQSREQLVDKLADLYTEHSDIAKITLRSLFWEWLDYKKQFANSANTIKRHKQHYKKYFEGCKLFSKTLPQIDLIELEVTCNRIVRENKMTRKEWTNVKTILIGMFRYAERKHYISSNPMSNLEITVKFRQTNKKPGSVETFNSEERAALVQYIDSKYKETGDEALLAIKVNLMLGLRIAELAALKWRDIVDGKKIHIERGEIRDQENNCYIVADHTKVHRDRFVEIPPKALEILLDIKKKRSKVRCDDFIFMRGNERITSRQITYALEKYAKDSMRETKRSHKLRKTYASMLAVGGVPMDEIRRQLGHSNLQTTMAYIFNPLDEEETHNLITGALNIC